MPISLDETKAALSSMNHDATLKEVEAFINEQLSSSEWLLKNVEYHFFSTYCVVRFGPHFYGRISKTLAEEIIGRYKKFGWKKIKIQSVSYIGFVLGLKFYLT